MEIDELQRKRDGDGIKRGHRWKQISYRWKEMETVKNQGLGDEETGRENKQTEKNKKRVDVDIEEDGQHSRLRYDEVVDQNSTLAQFYDNYATAQQQ